MDRRHRKNSNHRHSKLRNSWIKKSSLQTIIEGETLHLVKKSELDSDPYSSFEFTVIPEKLVSEICDDDSDEIIPDVTESPELNDEEFIRFIVDSCIKAKNIAIRNKGRPCFKNIRHLCNRTQMDTLNFCYTMTNLDAHGIPWASKDFIYAFARIINSWYILKGYLENSGKLEVIDAALTNEFRNAFKQWHTANTDLIQHLINIFTNLAYGTSGQNTARVQCPTSELSDANRSSNINPPNLNDFAPAEQHSDVHELNNMCYESDQSKHSNVHELNNVCSESDQSDGGYLSPGSYSYPMKTSSSIANATSVVEDGAASTQVTDSTNSTDLEIRWNYQESFPNLDMPATVIKKFESIVKALWKLQCSKYVTYETQAESIPDYLDIISQPVFLSTVKENLQMDKYRNPDQVVHDLRKIVRNCEYYLTKRPNCWFKNCLSDFSRALEIQLRETFPSIDFSFINGDFQDFIL